MSKPNTKIIRGSRTGRLWSVEPYEGKLQYWIDDTLYVSDYKWKSFGESIPEAIWAIEGDEDEDDGMMYE